MATDDDLATLRARVAELERDCAEAYQVVGALWPPGDPAVVKALDNLDAAATGKPRPHDDLLPFVPNPDPRDASLPWPCTCGWVEGLRSAADRCDSATRGSPSSRRRCGRCASGRMTSSRQVSMSTGKCCATS